MELEGSQWKALTTNLTVQLDYKRSKETPFRFRFTSVTDTHGKKKKIALTAFSLQE